MIRPLTDAERATWNLEQPGARVASDLQAENSRYPNLRRSTIHRRALHAQGLAAIHALRHNVAALQDEVDRILEEAHGS